MNGTSYNKIPFRSSALFNIENVDKKIFLWSILVGLEPCEISHPNGVSNYRQNFNEINIQDFDFSNGFECSGNYKFEKLNICL